MSFSKRTARPVKQSLKAQRQSPLSHIMRAVSRISAFSPPRTSPTKMWLHIRSILITADLTSLMQMKPSPKTSRQSKTLLSPLRQNRPREKAAQTPLFQIKKFPLLTKNSQGFFITEMIVFCYCNGNFLCHYVHQRKQ